METFTLKKQGGFWVVMSSEGRKIISEETKNNAVARFNKFTQNIAGEYTLTEDLPPYQITDKIQADVYGDPIKITIRDCGQWATFDTKANLLKIGQGISEPDQDQINQWTEYIKNKVLPGLSERLRWTEGNYFIRFNLPPKSGRSRNQATGELEDGVSCYYAEYDISDNVFRLCDDSATPGAIFEYINAPIYLLSGNVVSRGSDNEPVIQNTKVIGRLKPDADLEGFRLLVKKAKHSP